MTTQRQNRNGSVSFVTQAKGPAPFNSLFQATWYKKNRTGRL
jgi:hypothetical protein